MTFRFLVFLSFTFCLNVYGQKNDLNQRIQNIFGNSNRGGFGDIQEPEESEAQGPQNLQATQSPQFLSTNGQMCKCVPYWKCENSNGLATSTDSRFYGEIDVRYNADACQDVLDVCCAQGRETSVPVTPPPITAPPSAAQSVCGMRNPGGIDFTLVGTTNEAGFGELPWQIALLSSKECLCGGSLIHPNVVLTGAHCVFNLTRDMLKVRAGEWDTQTEKERLPNQERSINAIITHPDFNARSLANDIALLILDQPFVLDTHVNVICLPPQGYIAQNRDCYASGWGKSSFGKEGKYSVILKKVELPMVDFNNCQESLRRTRLGKRFLLHESFVCAGGEADKDTCQGDGGGPLVCPIDANNRYAQVGAVAWGIGCGELEIPAVYTNVAYFRNWIDSHVQNYGFDTRVYTI